MPSPVGYLLDTNVLLELTRISTISKGYISPASGSTLCAERSRSCGPGGVFAYRNRSVDNSFSASVRENGQRMPGLNVHHPRLYLLLAAMFQFAHLIAGFRNRDLRLYLQRRFGLSPDEYTAAQPWRGADSGRDDQEYD